MRSVQRSVSTSCHSQSAMRVIVECERGVSVFRPRAVQLVHEVRYFREIAHGIISSLERHIILLTFPDLFL